MPTKQFHDFQQKIAASLAASDELYELLPFQPGLGRTPIVFTAIEQRFQGKQPRVLILTRAVLCQSWMEQFLKHGLLLADVRRGKDPSGEQVTISTIETLANRPAYLDHDWDLVIFDQLPQSHALARSISLLTLARKADAFWQIVMPGQLSRGLAARLTETGTMLRKLEPTASTGVVI